MTCLASTVRTARTPKWCRLCLADIRPGQRYNDERGACDGTAYAVPTHVPCRWLAEYLDLFDPWDKCFHEGVLANEWRRNVTPPSDDPLHQFAAVLGWWAQWRMS